MAGTTAPTSHPTPDREPESRFTFGLILEVAKVLEAHGYERFDGPQFVDLQQHLFHLLHCELHRSCTASDGTVVCPSCSQTVPTRRDDRLGARVRVVEGHHRTRRKEP
jgi:hypothetical protein